MQLIHNIKNIIRSDKYFVPLFTGLFFLVTLTGILHHEMWGDEAYYGIITAKSQSFSQLLNNYRFDQHPLTWNILIYLVYSIFHSLWSLKLLEVLISSISAFLILRYAPFSKLNKGLLVFSYFFVFEYAVLLRNYSLGILFTILFCILFSQKKDKIIWQSLVLFFLANINGYSLMLALSFWFMSFLNYINSRIKSLQNPFSTELITSILVVCAGTLLSLYQILPFRSGIFNQFSSIYFHWNPYLFKQTVISMFAAYFPIPNIFSSHFWNTSILMAFPYWLQWCFVFFTIILFILIATYYFSKSKLLSVIYVLGTVGITSFMYCVNSQNFARFYGHLFILLIACLWLGFYQVERFSKAKNDNIFIDFVDRNKQLLLTMLLSVQVISGLYFIISDIRKPFSASYLASQFINNNHYKKLPIVGYEQGWVSAMHLYQSVPFYYPESERWGSFNAPQFKADRLTPPDLLSRLVLFSEDHPKFLLVMTQDLALTRSDLELNRIAEFTDSIWANEIYYIYLVNKKQLMEGDVPVISVLPVESVKGCNELGILYYNAGVYDKAEELWNKAIAKDYFALSLHNNLGMVYLNRGDYEKPEKEYITELNHKPLDLLTLGNLGNLYATQGRWNLAIRQWEQIININPSEISTLKNLAMYYYNRQQYAKANKYFRQLQKQGVTIPSNMI